MLIPHSVLLSQKLLFDMEAHTVNDYVFILAQDRVGSHLLEKIIPQLSKAQFGLVFDMLTPKIKEFAHHGLSNFCIQALIKSINTDAQAESIAKCLEKEFKVLSKYRSG